MMFYSSPAASIPGMEFSFYAPLVGGLMRGIQNNSYYLGAGIIIVFVRLSGIFGYK